MAALASEEEARRHLAAAYRLCALQGWDDTVFTHLSVSVPGEVDRYLTSEYGLGFDEVCASNLVKVDSGGHVVGGSVHRINPTGFTIHGAVHRARPDAACVIHLHTEAGVALSMLEEGLLPLSQWSARLNGRIGYHDYGGLALGGDEQRKLVQALAGHEALVLRNHGTLSLGRNVAEAYMLMYYLERAAKAQLMAMSAIGGCVRPLAPEVVQATQAQWIGDGTEWDGDVEWPYLLRRLERLAPDYKR